MDDSENIIFHFNDRINFWLVRADGGKYFDDFVNNDYIGIKYNRVTIKDLNKIRKESIVSLDTVRDLMFKEYIKEKNISVNNLGTRARRQLTLHAKQTELFAFEMKVGDLVITPAKKSYKFALGVIVSEPFDEKTNVIHRRMNQSFNKDIVYACSDYRKRRKIQWLSIIDRRDLPKELAWIMNAHQAIAELVVRGKSKLFNLVSPIYKYNDQYYLRIYIGRGSNLSIYDWNKLISSLPNDQLKDIDLRANVNSPGYFTFLTSNMNGVEVILNSIWGFGVAGVFALIRQVVQDIIGKDNLKKKGIIEWIQDVKRRHSDNKVHELENKKKCNELVKQMDLEIKCPGKKVEKNNSISEPIDLDEKTDSKKEK